MGAHEDLLARAGVRIRARHREIHGPDPVPGATPPVTRSAPKRIPDDPLDGVVFASVVAEELAASEGLSWGDFAADLSGATGSRGWTVTDVRRVIKTVEEAASHD